jgi:hypothetical protein
MKKILFFCAALSFIINNSLFGSCGTASCPLHSGNFLYKGLFSLRINYEYINQDQIYVGSERSFIGAIRQHHDEVSTLNRITSLSLGYGIFDFLSVDLNLPFIQRKHSHIHNHHGEKIYQNWNFSSIGDLILTTDFSLLHNPEINSSMNLLGGVKLPTGKTNVENENREKADATLQPGSGSTDFIFGVSYSRDLFSIPSFYGYSALPMTVSMSYKLNTKGTEDFKFGNELLIHFSTGYRFIENASFLLQVNARFQEKADIGLTDESRESTGGKWLFVSPGLKIHLLETLSVSGYFQIPVYQDLNGIQQAAPYNLQFSVRHEMNLSN